MSLVHDGIPASPGIVVGPAHVLHWEIPVVHGGIIPPDEIEREVERFEEAREWAKDQVRQVQRKAAERLGPVEAQIFDPQLLMLNDVDLVAGTHAYIRDNHFSASRAFALRHAGAHNPSGPAAGTPWYGPR